LAPVTVSTKAGEPAGRELVERDAMLGPSTEKGRTFVTVPPGLVTCTLYAMGESSMPAGTVAVSMVVLTNDVTNAVPFKETVDMESRLLNTKLAPSTVRVVTLVPAGTEAGTTLERVGPITLNGSALEVAPPGCTTVTLATPAVASSALGTNAVSWFALTNVVASGVAVAAPAGAHCTWLPGTGGAPSGPTKLVPFTVSVNVPAPAAAEFGDKDVSVGTSTISIVSMPPPTAPQKSVAAVCILLKTPVWVGVPPIVMLGNGEVMPGGKFAGLLTPASLKTLGGGYGEFVGGQITKSDGPQMRTDPRDAVAGAVKSNIADVFRALDRK